MTDKSKRKFVFGGSENSNRTDRTVVLRKTDFNSFSHLMSIKQNIIGLMSIKSNIIRQQRRKLGGSAVAVAAATAWWWWRRKLGGGSLAAAARGRRAPPPLPRCRHAPPRWGR